jgi:hypothetical protein
MNSILIIVLAFLILFILQNIINNYMGINDVINKNINEVLTNNFRAVDNKKKEINDYIKKRTERKKPPPKFKDPFYKFPDPMLSNITHPLSAGYKPMFQNNSGPPDMTNLEVVRKSGLEYYIKNPIEFQPDYVNKDTMDADPGNYTMQGIARTDTDDDLNEMTSDTYLTKYPNYADSNFGNELTNVGYFFDNDENNNFVNLKNRILPDNCTIDGNSMNCKFNGHLQPIPDKLMKNDSRVLDNIGVLVDNVELVQSTNDFSYGDVSGGQYKVWSYPDDKPMNGGVEFGSVYASNPLGYNEKNMGVIDNLSCSTCAI